jgi:hypothetical protein
MLLAAVLTGLLALQASAPARTMPPLDDTLAPRRLRMPLAVPAPDYPGVLGAPIFAPDRRPGVPMAVSQGLHLIGVASDGRQSQTAIVRGLDGAVHVLRPGERLQGWRLVSVSGDRASFDGPGGTMRLHVEDAAAASAATESESETEAADESR